MSLYFDIGYRVLVVTAAIASAILGVLAARNRHSKEAAWLTLLAFACTIWTGMDALNWLTTSRTWSLTMTQIQWFGTSITPTTLFVFVLLYTGREHLITRRTLAVLYTIPIVTLGFVLTSGAHDLMWANIEATEGYPGGYEFHHGPAFYAFTLYAYAVMVAATWYILAFLVRSSGLYRGQALAILVCGLAGWVGNVVFVSGLSPLDFTPVGFAFSATALGFAVLRYRLTDVVPVARDTVVDNITDGVIVLDGEDRIVDVNPRGRRLIGASPTDPVIGEHVASVFPELVVERYTDVSEGHDVIAVDGDAGTRYLDVDISPLADRRGETIGRLFIVRDVTDRRRDQHELERQNEQLDRFASLVSHDLRNPLNVAGGYLEVLKEQYDDPAVEEIDQSLDRMEHIIEDVLTLTREGQAIDETEEVALADLARKAWQHVDTADATLAVDVPDDHTVQADPSRLVQAFENLYRNAIDHVGEDVGVTVGVLSAAETAADRRFLDGPAGFYVEDDGPGIPADERDEVLEAGYTTSSDGTGLGLDIVKSIVEAHGWTLSVGEGSGGGARFVVEYEAPAAGETTSDDGETTSDDGETTSDDGETTPDDGETTPDETVSA